VCLSRQGRSDRSHFAPLLTVLTGKQRRSLHSGNCASHPGKADNSKSRPPSKFGLGRNRELYLARPRPRPRPQLRPREKVSASQDPGPRPQPRSREKVFASPDPGPWPRSREKVSASPDPGPRPWRSRRRLTSAPYQLRYGGSIIALPLASRLRL
jgi:hypothetical protein